MLLQKTFQTLVTAWFCLAIFCADYALAIIIRPDRDDQKYRNLAEQFPAACWIPDDDPNGCRHGTGTLLSPRWVATAAHVVDSGNKVVGNTVVRAEHPAPTRVQFEDRFYRIKRIVFHPSYDQINFSGTDLALLELEEPVVGVTPIPINVADNEVGQMAHLVGYGFSGTFETGQPSGDDKLYHESVPTKRAATNVITSKLRDETIRDVILLTTIEQLPFATDLEGSCATADSGGPLLIFDQGKPFLVGVASRLYGNEKKHQHIDGQDAYVAVSHHACWIEKVTGEDFGAPCQNARWLILIAAIVSLCVIGLYLRRKAPGANHGHRSD